MVKTEPPMHLCENCTQATKAKTEYCIRNQNADLCSITFHRQKTCICYNNILTWTVHCKKEFGNLNQLVEHSDTACTSSPPLLSYK